jgi:hypothetical protein
LPLIPARGWMDGLLRWVAGVVAAFRRPTDDIPPLEPCLPQNAKPNVTAAAITTADTTAAEVSLDVSSPSDSAVPISADPVASIPPDPVDQVQFDPTAPVPSNPAIPTLSDPAVPLPIDLTARVPSNPQEIERRRELIRKLFNDFWDGLAEKPAAFVDRLDQAEEYLNERLASSGELWRLDAKMRQILGLPMRSNARRAALN